MKALLAVALSGALVAGCNPTGGGSEAEPSSSSPGLRSPVSVGNSPAPAATCDPSGHTLPTAFHQGSATIRIATGQESTTTLDRIGDTTFYARFDPECPAIAQAEWTDSSGQWLLTVLANVEPNGAWSGQRATLWIEDYAGAPPLYAAGSPCSITITEISPSGLTGNAECHNLRWLNDLEAQTNPGGASPLPNLPPFDASIMFEARP